MAFLDKLFGKKEEEPLKEETLFAYAKGELIPSSQVKDETFATEMLGRGVAIIPEEGIVTAPTDGKMAVVFETKHALALTTKSGAEILIHIGIDTVKLKGEHFTTKVKVGDQVKKGDVLATFELDKIVDKGYDPVIPMIITNSFDFENFDIKEPKAVEISDEVMKISK